MDIILLAVPGFFLLIVVELVAERIRGTNYYRLNDSLTSLSTGTLSQLMNVMQLLVPFTFYVYIYENFRLFSLPESPLVWVTAFIAYDFCYYWKHRFGHEMNIMWAAHVVHHSSEEFNLTTALRQTSGSNIGFIIYLPLALVGLDPGMLVTVGSLNLIYQYWVHTQHIDRLGWMESVFVTPSNHRGHHAQNTVYIDRNYGGVFIIWDRLFGTFQAELDHDKPVFGIRGALASWNPVWANLQIFSQLWQDCLNTKNWWHKLTIWFRRTGWRPPDVVADSPRYKLEDLESFEKFEIPLSGREKSYALLQHLVTTGMALLLLLNLDSFSAGQQLIVIAALTLGSISTGAILEQQLWSIWSEAIKYAVFLAILIWLQLGTLAIVMMLVATLISTALYRGFPLSMKHQKSLS